MFILPLAGCVKDSQPDSNEFAIYLVANITLDKAYAVQDTDLSQLELQDKPWLSLADIDYYDISSHYIYLKETTSIFGEDDKESFVKPFVVVANGERCYLGYFLSRFSSLLPRSPCIFYPTFLADDVIAIEKPLPNGESDVRNDPRIREVLAKAGKLNPGLKIILNDASVVNRAEVVTMSYSFTITNENDSPLYVPDPDKMGSSLFHYYTNGLWLTKIGNSQESFRASPSTVTSPEPLDMWDINWFTKLNSHESINRTVLLKGYDDNRIGYGDYQCSFTYKGPGMMSKNDRLRSDGRIWIGKIDASTIVINIDN